MLPVDFSETFNAAVKAQDWPLVTILGESAIAEHGASKDILYNLGVAYLKTQKAPLAVSVFLGVPLNEQDANFRAAQSEALRMVGSSKDDFELGAHGFTAGMMGISRSLTVVDPYSWCVSSFGLTIIFGVVLASGLTFLKNKKLASSCKIGLYISIFLTIMSAASIAVETFYQSHWGAVVSSENAALRSIASDKSDPLKMLKPGKPVLVLGDVTKPWVRVIESDGGAGWMNALELRVIHDAN